MGKSIILCNNIRDLEVTQMNVRDIVEIVLALNGERRIEPTCDQLIEGDWNQPVTGVVTAFMATVDVIHRVIETGCNYLEEFERLVYQALE